MSNETVSRITGPVLEAMGAWATRPPDEVYAIVRPKTAPRVPWTQLKALASSIACAKSDSRSAWVSSAMILLVALARCAAISSPL